MVFLFKNEKHWSVVRLESNYSSTASEILRSTGFYYLTSRVKPPNNTYRQLVSASDAQYYALWIQMTEYLKVKLDTELLG